MCKSIDTLAILMAEQMALDSLSGHLFALCNRKNNTVNIPYLGRNGFGLYHKRLERDHFLCFWADFSVCPPRPGIR